MVFLLCIKILNFNHQSFHNPSRWYRVTSVAHACHTSGYTCSCMAFKISLENLRERQLLIYLLDNTVSVLCFYWLSSQIRSSEMLNCFFYPIDYLRDYGGAVYVADDTNSGTCMSTSYKVYSANTECFLQTLVTIVRQKLKLPSGVIANPINTLFTRAVAYSKSGCHQSHFAPQKPHVANLENTIRQRPRVELVLCIGVEWLWVQWVVVHRM